MRSNEASMLFPDNTTFMKQTSYCNSEYLSAAVIRVFIS